VAFIRKSEFQLSVQKLSGQTYNPLVRGYSLYRLYVEAYIHLPRLHTAIWQRSYEQSWTTITSHWMCSGGGWKHLFEQRTNEHHSAPPVTWRFCVILAISANAITCLLTYLRTRSVLYGSACCLQCLLQYISRCWEILWHKTYQDTSFNKTIFSSEYWIIRCLERREYTRREWETLDWRRERGILINANQVPCCCCRQSDKKREERATI